MNVRILSVSALALGIALTAAQAANTSRAQADAFAKKVAIINQQPEAGAGATAPRRTRVTEGELNSWFVYYAPPLLPDGVAEPKVTIIGNGKLLGAATVDLEAVGRRRATGGALDLWSYLGGRVPLSVTGVLHTRDGQGRFELQAADVSGVPIPNTLLQEIVSYYTRTADHPQGLRLDDAFALPANIKEIQVGQGQAIVVQ